MSMASAAPRIWRRVWKRLSIKLAAGLSMRFFARKGLLFLMISSSPARFALAENKGPSTFFSALS